MIYCNWQKYELDCQENTRSALYQIYTRGIFSTADHLKLIEEVVSSDFWLPGTNIPLNHRNLEFGQTDISIFKAASDNHEKNDVRIGDGKAAILMKSLADFGRGCHF